MQVISLLPGAQGLYSETFFKNGKGVDIRRLYLLPLQ
jgi:hypothetical protein